MVRLLRMDEGDAEAHLHNLEVENEQLRTALTSRVVIEQAKGILSVVLEATPEEAFELMRLQARSTRRLLRNVAAEVVATRGACAADWKR